MMTSSFGVKRPMGPGSSTFIIPKKQNLQQQEKERISSGKGKSDDYIRREKDIVRRNDSAADQSNPRFSNDARLNVWTGSLRFDDQAVESVDLYSPFRDGVKPPGFSTSLELQLLISSADCQKYAPIADLFSRPSGLLTRYSSVLVCLPSLNHPEQEPIQASYLYLINTFSPLFVRIYDKLKARETVAVGALSNKAVVLLLPEGKLTNQLGIPSQNKPIFHCIFLVPKPDITYEFCRRGLLSFEQNEPTAYEKLDGSDEAINGAVEKYQKTSGLPIAKRTAPPQLNSLLSPDQTPPGGKPPTPYIPTPGSSASLSSKYHHQQHHHPSMKIHSRHAYNHQQQQSSPDWMQSLLQPPPPPPPPPAEATPTSGVTRGILSRGHGSRGGTDERRAKNQSLIKSVLEQTRKVGEAKVPTVDGVLSVSGPTAVPSLPVTMIPPPPITAAAGVDQSMVTRDPRLMRHGIGAIEGSLSASTIPKADIKPKLEITKPEAPKVNDEMPKAIAEHQIPLIPMEQPRDASRDEKSLPPRDPRSRRPKVTEEVNVPKMAMSAMIKAEKMEMDMNESSTIVSLPEHVADDKQHYHEHVQQTSQKPSTSVAIDESFPMEIVNDDEDSRPYSPSQATPPPSITEEAAEDEEEEHRMQIAEDTSMDGEELEKVTTDTAKIDAQKALELSPISLVRTLIKSPPLSASSSSFVPKVPSTKSSSAPMNVSGFGFDFLDWNSTASTSTTTGPSTTNGNTGTQTHSIPGLNGGATIKSELTHLDLIDLLNSDKMQTDEPHATSVSQPQNDMDLRSMWQPQNNAEESMKEEDGDGSSGKERQSTPPQVGQQRQESPLSPPPIGRPPSLRDTIPRCIPSAPISQNSSPPSLLTLTVPPPSIPLPSLNNGNNNNGFGAFRPIGGFVSPKTIRTPPPTPPVRPTIIPPLMASSSSTLGPRILHRLDIPPPALHLPPPSLMGLLPETNTSTPTMPSRPYRAVVQLDPDMIICRRIELDTLRSLFAAAKRHNIVIRWHQSITDRLMQFGFAAKPYLSLLDDFVAQGFVCRMGKHLCDEGTMNLQKLLICTISMAREEREKNNGVKKARIIFLSAVVTEDSEEAVNFRNNQIDVMRPEQFVEQFN